MSTPDVLSREAIVTGIMAACSVDRPRAEELARRARGEPEPTVPPEQAAKDAAVREKDEQRVITAMARAIGCTVRSTSQARAAKVSPGIPDLWITHRARGFAGWFEVKRQIGGRTTSEQVDFGEECVAAGIPYGRGDRHAFAHWLSGYGFLPPAIPL